MDIRNPYTFTLLSAMQNHFESTVSVIAAVSIHNTDVECTGVTSRDSITIKIAGRSCFDPIMYMLVYIQIMEAKGTYNSYIV